MGIVNRSLQQIDQAFTHLNPVIFNIAVALVILLIGFIVGRIASTLVKRLLQTLETDKAVYTFLRIHVKLERALSGLVAFIIYVFAMLLALGQAGLLSILIEWLSYAVVIAILIAFALGLRNVFPNFLAGLVVKRRIKFLPGDHLRVGTAEGTIQRVNTLFVYLTTKEGDLLSVPFAELFRETSKVRKAKRKKT